jgi:heterodisulfide reductase subunit C2
MTVKIKKQTTETGLRRIVEEMSGVDLSLCYQCKKCTSGCPVAKLSQSPPSEIVRRLQLGAGNELLENEHIWLCLACETCYSRCPMQINLAAVMDALRTLALTRKAALPLGNSPLFNRAFLKAVESYGRSYDLRAIMQYKLGGGNLMQDVEKFPSMLKKGKMAILPPSGADKKTVKQIFKKAQQLKEAANEIRILSRVFGAFNGPRYARVQPGGGPFSGC